MSVSEGDPRSHSPPHDSTGARAGGTDQHRLRGMELLGGSRYVIVFVDTASRLQGPYGTQDKSAPAILAVVKRFVEDAAVPRAFRTDNGSGRTRSLPSTVMILGSAAN